MFGLWEMEWLNVFGSKEMELLQVFGLQLLWEIYSFPLFSSRFSSIMQGYIFFKWPVFYSPDGRTLCWKFLLLKATQPPLINIFYCIFRSLWSQNLEKYVKFCENSQSTNILPQIWLKVQILSPPPPHPPAFLKNIYPWYSVCKTTMSIYRTSWWERGGNSILRKSLHIDRLESCWFLKRKC